MYVHFFAGSKYRKTSSRSRPQTSWKPQKRFPCPFNGCHGLVVNLRRHYKDIHREVTLFEVNETIKSLFVMEEAQRKKYAAREQLIPAEIISQYFKKKMVSLPVKEIKKKKRKAYIKGH